MGKIKKRKKPITPRSRIKSVLQRLWLCSRERAEAMRLSNKKCVECDKIYKREELEVHHKHGILWEQLVDLVQKRILISQDDLIVLCKGCHKKAHDLDQEIESPIMPPRKEFEANIIVKSITSRGQLNEKNRGQLNEKKT